MSRKRTLAEHKNWAPGNDMSGQKHGRLLVIRYSHNVWYRTPKQIQHTVFYKCRCECGKTCIVRGSFLKNGNTKSCGCIRIKHGGGIKSGALFPTWRRWRAMVDRCIKPRNRAYKYYGARGISVCKRWRDFANFLKDMGKAPKNRVLDRINNDGNYEPSNCRWATRKQSANNTSRAKKYKTTTLK